MFLFDNFSRVRVQPGFLVKTLDGEWVRVSAIQPPTPSEPGVILVRHEDGHFARYTADEIRAHWAEPPKGQMAFGEGWMKP